MQYAYLAGSFIETLQGVFYTIFDKVLTPVLREILEVFIKFVLRLLWARFAEAMLSLLAILCSLVDFVESIFNVFAGITPVEMKEGAGYVEIYMLDAFFQMETITTAFTYITVMAVAICMIFTIIKTAKSISDMALENKNPISHVLTNGMKAGLTFMLIPFLCIFLLQLATIVTGQVNTALSGKTGKATIGTVIFLTAGLDADKNTTKACSPFSDEWEQVTVGRTPSFDKGPWESYMTGEKSYRKLNQVREDFHAANFNYIVGFASAVLLLLVLSGAVMVFIRRIFEILLLYLVSPLFVSTIPLDDGAMFSKWRELFIARFFSGFGIIFMMKYYLLLIPFIFGKDLVLYDADLPNAGMINNVLKMFFIIGGAWAVYKSQHLIMQVMNPEAAMADQQASAMLTGMIIGAATTAASAATAAATGGASAALGGIGAAANMAGKASNVAGKASDVAGKAMDAAGALGDRGSSDNGAFRG